MGVILFERPLKVKIISTCKILGDIANHMKIWWESMSVVDAKYLHFKGVPKFVKFVCIIVQANMNSAKRFIGMVELTWNAFEIEISIGRNSGIKSSQNSKNMSKQSLFAS